MKIAMVGAGGVGGYFGARLAHAGEDVHFIARGRHLAALREGGLYVDSPEGDLHVERVQATDDPDEVGAADAVLFCVKTWQLGEAAAAAAPMIGPHTTVVPLLNGVEAADELAAAIDPRRVALGMCGVFSYVTAPGRLRHVGGQVFVRAGERDNRRSERLERLCGAFLGAGVPAEVPDDIHVALWRKFMMVVPFGGVATACRAPLGAVLAVPAARGLLEEAVGEVLAVGRARGVALSEQDAADILDTYRALPAAGTTSMHRDIVDGRPSELEAWTGAVVRLGARAGVATPVHRFLYGALLSSEMRARGELEFPE